MTVQDISVKQLHISYIGGKILTLFLQIHLQIAKSTTTKTAKCTETYVFAAGFSKLLESSRK